MVQNQGTDAGASRPRTPGIARPSLRHDEVQGVTGSSRPVGDGSHPRQVPAVPRGSPQDLAREGHGPLALRPSRLHTWRLSDAVARIKHLLRVEDSLGLDAHEADAHEGEGAPRAVRSAGAFRPEAAVRHRSGPPTIPSVPRPPAPSRPATATVSPAPPAHAPAPNGSAATNAAPTPPDRPSAPSASPSSGPAGPARPAAPEPSGPPDAPAPSDSASLGGRRRGRAGSGPADRPTPPARRPPRAR